MSKAWKPQTTAAAMETSIYWQEYVARNTKDPEQRKRCTERAQAMKAEVIAMKAQQDVADYCAEGMGEW